MAPSLLAVDRLETNLQDPVLGRGRTVCHAFAKKGGRQESEAPGLRATVGVMHICCDPPRFDEAKQSALPP